MNGLGGKQNNIYMTYMKNIISSIRRLASDDGNLLKLQNADFDLPFVSVSKSSLGGQTSYFISFSWQPKDEWSNKIFQNSDHAKLSLTMNLDGSGTIEKITGYNTPKFRKTKFKNIDDAIDKIKKWVLSSR